MKTAIRNDTMFEINWSRQASTLVLIICTSAVHLYLLTVRDNLSFRQALKQGVGSAIVFCLSILVIWPVSALLLYHMRVSDMSLLLAISTLCWFGLGLIHFRLSSDGWLILQLLFLNITTIEQVCCPSVAAHFFCPRTWKVTLTFLCLI